MKTVFTVILTVAAMFALHITCKHVCIKPKTCQCQCQCECCGENDKPKCCK